MKSKKLLRTLAAFCTALVLMGGFSVPAYAGGGGEPADETNDSNVQVEQPEETPPLTPDGNATLVDDYGGNKQLITVTTKNGNYFYILVDRDDEGENTVHFLNQVDEADLMALMEDENSEEPPAVCSCTEKCQAGAINRNCPVCAFTMTSCTGKAAEPEEPPAAEPEPEKKSGMNPAVLLLVVALLGGGGALYYFKFMKNKPKTKGPDNLDDYDYGDEEDELWESEEGAEEEPEESEEEPE